MTRYWLLPTLLLACSLWSSHVSHDHMALGQVSSSEPKANRSKPEKAETETAKPQPKNSAAKLPAFTREREAAALTFATRHHAELADLLNYLSRHNRPEYEAAICELFRTCEWLANIQERDRERHALELASWKLGSRIKLLAARLTMQKDSQLEEQLLTALGEQADLRIELLKLDQRRTQLRLQKVEEQLANAVERRDAEVKRQFKNYTKNTPTKNPVNNNPTPSSSAIGANSKDINK